MKQIETENKKLASYVAILEGSALVQKSCLVDINTGVIEVGETKSYGKVDNKLKEQTSRVEYKGQEFEIDKKNIDGKDVLMVKHLDAFKQTMHKPSIADKYKNAEKAMEKFRTR